MKNRPSAVDMSLAFTCDFCKSVSYWTRNTPAPYCLVCRCDYCAGLKAFQTLDAADGGVLHSYCPACIKAGDTKNMVAN